MRDARRLELVEIPMPCAVPWDDMTGDAVVRRCGECRKNVFNIASLTTREAVTLIRATEGWSCLQIWRRRDGTVVTTSCWERLRAARRRPWIAPLVILVALMGLLRVRATIRWARYLSTFLEPARPVAAAPPPPSIPAPSIPAPILPPPMVTGGVPPQPIEEVSPEAPVVVLHHRARNLAAIGECETAVMLARRIERLDPGYYRKKVLRDHRLSACSLR